MWTRSFARRFRRLSEHRFVPLAMGALAIALMLPSIGGGLFHDDLIHWAKLQKDVGLPARYYGTPHLPSDSGTAAAAMRDMFAMTRTPGEEKTLKDLGLVPWWASEQLRISNWRPLTALTHWLDYRLFPDSPALMHVPARYGYPESRISKPRQDPHDRVWARSRRALLVRQ